MAFRGMCAFRGCFGFQKFAEQGEGELSTPGGRVDLGGWLVSHYDLSRKRKNIYIYKKVQMSSQGCPRMTFVESYPSLASRWHQVGIVELVDLVFKMNYRPWVSMFDPARSQGLASPMS